MPLVRRLQSQPPQQLMAKRIITSMSSNNNMLGSPTSALAMSSSYPITDAAISESNSGVRRRKNSGRKDMSPLPGSTGYACTNNGRGDRQHIRHLLMEESLSKSQQTQTHTRSTAVTPATLMSLSLNTEGFDPEPEARVDNKHTHTHTPEPSNQNHCHALKCKAPHLAQSLSGTPAPLPLEAASSAHQATQRPWTRAGPRNDSAVEPG